MVVVVCVWIVCAMEWCVYGVCVWSVCMRGVSVYGACAYGVQNKYNSLVIHGALDDFSVLVPD